MNKHHSHSRYTLSALLLLFVLVVKGQQVTIVSADVNSYNVTPRGLCQVVLMSPAANVQVILQAELMDAANEPLLTVRTNPFMLHTGMNMAAGTSFTISSVEYSGSSIASYMRTSNILPTGKYNYCVKVIVVTGVEEGDQYCDNIESDINSFLYLVSPGDKDTINTLYPVLIWNHSDPFNALSPGEFYRMLLVPISDGQSADEAIAVNTPIFLKNNLEENQVQYPYDAPALEPGKHYGWQVQLMGSNVVINKTEAWEFIEDKPKVLKDNKYATVKTTLDGGYYTAVNNRIFFRFDEAYASPANSDVKCSILDTYMEPVKSKTLDASNGTIAFKKSGFNQYEVDLNGMNIQSGYYYLQISNEKGQVFMLKFMVN
jgi:hypothetical protein